MAWQYNREEQHFEVLPEGKYRIRIKAVEKAQSKGGNDMLIFQFEVSGTNKVLYHYLVFLPDRPEITNRNLTQFFDSFADINDGDFNIINWMGKVGACKIKHDEYNGEKQERIQYFIKADKATDLPPWQEPSNNSSSSATPAPSGYENTNLDIPF